MLGILASGKAVPYQLPYQLRAQSAARLSSRQASEIDERCCGILQRTRSSSAASKQESAALAFVLAAGSAALKARDQITEGPPGGICGQAAHPRPAGYKRLKHYAAVAVCVFDILNPGALKCFPQNGLGAWESFDSEKIKPRAASPSRGRSTRVAQRRGVARTATNPGCVAPSTRRRPRHFRARAAQSLCWRGIRRFDVKLASRKFRGSPC